MNLINTFFNVPVFLNSLPQLLWGLVVTLQIGVTSILCGLVGGLFLAVARLYAPAFFKLLIRGYIDIFRSIPLLVGIVREVSEARKARGAGFSLRALAAPAVVRALRSADAMGDALIARGVDD
jgi:ABC-type amino acid transport system permease subunit